MASLVSYEALNMQSPTVWYGVLDSYSDTHITIAAGSKSGTYRGDFSYDAYGNVFGQLYSYETRSGGSLTTIVNGLSVDAYQMMNYVQSGNTTGAFSYALAGNDAMEGSSYGDTLIGFSGHDGLHGNGGNDRLLGGSGNDRLTGGAGKDVLAGNTGSDVFDFNLRSESGISATSADVISDFARGRDKIDLSTIDAFTATAANNTFVFVGTTAFSRASAGEVRVREVNVEGSINDHTMVFIDTDGDTGVEMAIRLTGLHALTVTDFIL